MNPSHQVLLYLLPRCPCTRQCVDLEIQPLQNIIRPQAFLTDSAEHRCCLWPLMCDYVRLRFEIFDPFEQNSRTELEVIDHAVPFPLETLHLLGQIVDLSPLTGNDLLHLLLTHTRGLGALSAHHRTHCLCGGLTLLEIGRRRIYFFLLARQKCCFSH